MGDRPLHTDTPGAPTASADQPSLLERSGFLSGLKKLRSSAADVVESGVDKGKALVHSDTAKKLTGQVTAAGHEIMTNPTTGKLVESVKQGGQAVVREDSGHVQRALAAGRNKDVGGVISNVLPLAEQAAMPHALVMKVGKDAVISQASPEHQAALRKLSDGLPNLSIGGLARGEVLHQVEKGNVTPASLSREGQELGSKTSHLLKDLSGKIFSKSTTADQPEKR